MPVLLVVDYRALFPPSCLPHDSLPQVPLDEHHTSTTPMSESGSERESGDESGSGSGSGSESSRQ